jgi:hypothetical protein
MRLPLLIVRAECGSRPEESLDGDVSKGSPNHHPSRPSASGRVLRPHPNWELGAAIITRSSIELNIER